MASQTSKLHIDPVCHTMPAAEFLPCVYLELNEKLRLKAERDLHETEENITSGLKKLKQWIRDESVYCCPEETFLTMFLRSKKYDAKRSFEQLKRYAMKRQALMEYHIYDAGFGFARSVLESGICGVLPLRDHEGRAIVFFRANKLHHNLHALDDIFRTMSALNHFVLSFPISQVSGVCFLGDASISSWKVIHHLFRYARLFGLKSGDFPGRFKRIDLINSSVVFRTCFSLVRTLFPPKINDRTTIHGYEKGSLLKVYSPAILPEEFGGNLGPLRDTLNAWVHEFEEFLPKLQASNEFYRKNSYK